ncbi:MAG TPA: thioredoxin domain-containing protein [Galbitalea sp.]|nr:thioredoxin domain-containing protein [Galbitalea sp.]
MANRLIGAVSPYLRSHAENPVDWWPWGSAAFTEAERRQVPVFISIGYATCHWCHVMARESFSDPVLAAYQNENFVSIKVDREEHPDVDASYLAAASAFTDQLGWPLSVFATPSGRAFFAGTYFPPVPVNGLPSFREVLEAMVDAWRDQRENVEETAGRLAAALAAPRPSDGDGLPTSEQLDAVVDELLALEDKTYRGFGGAPKFPVAPVLRFLQERGMVSGPASGLWRRTVEAMERSALRDPIDGGFFRYSTRRDWSEPHYERMLYDNAQLLRIYSHYRRFATGIASFLLTTLRLPSGGFASAQDSESVVDGERLEGGYYRLDAAGRGREIPPALDEKVLTGWNGLAIGALAFAGASHREPDWIAAATSAADLVATGDLVRARIGNRVSSAKPTLEDFGMLAEGLLDLAIATGEVRFAIRARELVGQCAVDGGFAVPGGGDPVLAAHGMAVEDVPSDGAYPSGLSSIARAAILLDRLGSPGFLDTASTALAAIGSLALANPISFGSALSAMSMISLPVRQLVVVTSDATSRLSWIAHAWRAGIGVAVTPDQAGAFADAGFELFDGRAQLDDRETAYLCDNFVCQLAVFDADSLEAQMDKLPRS